MTITVTWRFLATVVVLILIAVSLSASAIVQLRMDDNTVVYVWTAEEMTALNSFLAQVRADRDAADANKARVCI